MFGSQLIDAADSGDLQRIRMLLDRGAAIDHKDSGDYTALILAAYAGHIEVIRLLLDRGADIHHQDQTGLTALSVAAHKGYKKIAEVIEEQVKAPEGRKIKIELFFLGKQPVSFARDGLFSTIKSIFLNEVKDVKPVVYLPKELVGIIEDYLKPAGTPAPKRKP